MDPMANQGDKAPSMLAVFSVFLVLPLIAVSLRFLARRLTRVAFWWDDWLLLVAAVRIPVYLSNVSLLNPSGHCHSQFRLFTRE